MFVRDEFIVKIYSSIFFMFFLGLCYSQAPNIQWQNRYGGASVNLSYVSKQTADGGFVVAGRSNSNVSGDKTENSRGGHDYWIVKTDANGVKQWDKTIGGASPTGSENDILYSILQTNDGGYVICGSSDSPFSGDKTENNIGSLDYWIVKLNHLGNIEWQNVIGGSSLDEATSIIQTLDGGFLVGGYSNSNISGDKTQNSKGLNDYWVIKLSVSGEVEWDKTFGGNGNDNLYSIIQTTDGGYILAGNSNSDISGDKTENSRGLSDYWIIKLSTSGVILWQKTYGGSGFEQLYDVISTFDSGILLAGYSYSNISGDKSENSRGLNDYWVVRLDALGAILWQRTIGGNGSDNLVSVLESTDNGYVLVGDSDSTVSGEKTDSVVGIYDSWVVKLNSSGLMLWQKTIGGTLGEGFNSVSQTLDGGYFLSGSTASPVSGDITIPARGQNDYWAVKLSPDNLSINEPQNFNNIILYPNPVSDVIHLENPSNYLVENITIYAVNGAVVKKFSKEEVLSSMVVSDLPSGFYFAKIAVGGTVLNYRIVKL